MKINPAANSTFILFRTFWYQEVETDFASLNFELLLITHVLPFMSIPSLDNLACRSSTVNFSSFISCFIVNFSSRNVYISRRSLEQPHSGSDRLRATLTWFTTSKLIEMINMFAIVKFWKKIISIYGYIFVSGNEAIDQDPVLTYCVSWVHGIFHQLAASWQNLFMSYTNNKLQISLRLCCSLPRYI